MLRWVALMLLVLLFVLQSMLWGAHGGLRDYHRMRAAVRQQQEQNGKLEQRNEALSADVEDLKSGDQAIEARARAELGLVRPGETFYQVVASPAAASGSAQAQAQGSR